MRRLAVLALALVGSAVVVASSHGSESGLVLRPCTVQTVAARCGILQVPENRARPNGRRIALRVVVIPARTRPALRDAFTYLAGGPGGAAATQMPYSAVTIWSAVHERHDIVLVDQRGTGSSNPLVCRKPSQPVTTEDERRRYVQACLAGLKADVTQYGTRAAMDDLEAVRKALGYRSFDVYGTSYGGTAAQIYLKRHSRSVRTLVLDGATFVDVPFYSRFAANGQRALDLIAARCSAQPACAAAFPDWRAQLAALIAAWNEEPQRLSATETITGDGLAGAVQKLSLTSDGASRIPLVVARAAAGDYGPLSSVLGSNDVNISVMYWEIMCSEPWVGAASRGPWGTYLDGVTANTLDELRAACGYLPRRTEPASQWTRPSSNVPTLVLAGEADPQDPIGNLPGLSRALPKSRVVIAPGQGHAVGQYGCLGDLVARFVDRATARGLDTSCVAKIQAPPFVTR